MANEHKYVESSIVEYSSVGEVVSATGMKFNELASYSRARALFDKVSSNNSKGILDYMESALGENFNKCLSMIVTVDGHDLRKSWYQVIGNWKTKKLISDLSYIAQLTTGNTLKGVQNFPPSYALKKFLDEHIDEFSKDKKEPNTYVPVENIIGIKRIEHYNRVKGRNIEAKEFTNHKGKKKVLIEEMPVGRDLEKLKNRVRSERIRSVFKHDKKCLINYLKSSCNLIGERVNVEVKRELMPEHVKRLPEYPKSGPYKDALLIQKISARTCDNYLKMYKSNLREVILSKFKAPQRENGADDIVKDHGGGVNKDENKRKANEGTGPSNVDGWEIPKNTCKKSGVFPKNECITELENAYDRLANYADEDLTPTTYNEIRESFYILRRHSGVRTAKNGVKLILTGNCPDKVIKKQITSDFNLNFSPIRYISSINSGIVHSFVEPKLSKSVIMNTYKKNRNERPPDKNMPKGKTAKKKWLLKQQNLPKFKLGKNKRSEEDPGEPSIKKPYLLNNSERLWNDLIRRLNIPKALEELKIRLKEEERVRRIKEKEYEERLKWYFNM